ncbi:hypothetical protein MKX03_006130 [Papaver bracteatum]|nr:hypothetical protein MKX03_006130 [Papaver bracteatum]
MGSHPHRSCEGSHSSAHDDRHQRSRSPQVCSRGLVTPTSTIVVKGLPKETTEENIHQILAEWRPLRNVRVMMKKNSSVCRGIAFIDFPSVVASRKMMDEIGDCGLDDNGRKLSFEYSSHPHRRCEDYQSFEHDDRRQRSRSPQVCSHGLVKTPTSTIVVKGLPKETTEETIHQILAEWRPIRNVRVMMKKNSSVCRGVAFIDFPSVVAARKMMDEIGDCGLDVNGKKLSFEYRLGKISELASEDSIVNAGAPDSRDPEELLMLKVGAEPYESYSAENNCVLFSIVRSAKALEDTFNSLEGVTCEKADEGLYLFPRIQFSKNAIKAADAANTAPDAFYAKRLIEATGIVVLPGSDFGQVPGIWCIGLPILLQNMEIPSIITGLTDFHQAFMAEFHD